MAKVECGHEILALRFVLITFREQDTHTQNLRDAFSEESGLDEVIRFCRQDFCERFGGCNQQSLSVENMQISDDSIVRHFICPSPRRYAGRMLDELGPLTIEKGAILGSGNVTKS